MATLIAEGAASITQIEVRTRNVEQATPEDVLWCDGLVLGHHQASVAPAVRAMQLYRGVAWLVSWKPSTAK